MKKILSILVIACVAMLFVSCHKDGIYNPSKKISKIYYTGSDGVKNLSQVWTWNKNNTLEKIDFYSGGSLSYTYNFTYEKKRLVRMNNYANNRSIEYKYEKNMLKEANTYSGGTLQDTYTFTHKNGKIVKITDTYLNKKGAIENEINPLQFILSEELCQTVDQNRKRISDSKGTIVWNYELTWEKNNPTKMVVTREGSSANSTYELSYDKKNNPYYNAFLNFYFEDNTYSGNLSKNNIVRIEYREIDSDGDQDTGVERYEYTYDGNYPKARRYMGDGYTTLIEFEYTK